MVQPINGATVSVSATASSAATTFGDPGKGCSFVRVYNDGAATVFVRVGFGAQTAVTTDLPVTSKGTQILRKVPGMEGVAAIGSTAGPHTVYFTPLEGV